MKISSRFKNFKFCFFSLIFTFCTFTNLSGQTIERAGTTTPESDLSGHFNIISSSPDVMPNFPAGLEGLEKYILQNLRYPIWAMEAGIEGVIVIGLTIGTSGQVIDPLVLKSCSVEFPGDLPSPKVEPKLRLYEGLDQAALYLVKNMPNWQPALVNGQPVNAKISIPFTFKLDELSKGQQKWVNRKNDYTLLEQLFASFPLVMLQGMQQGRGGIRIGK